MCFMVDKIITVQTYEKNARIKQSAAEKTNL